MLGNQTLADLDAAIQEAFNHEPGHLSFFKIKGRRYSDREFRLNTDYDTKRKIQDLQLVTGDKFDYTYDLGANIQHVIELIKIQPTQQEADYPYVSRKNKPKYMHCQQCDSEDAIAKWWCP